MPDTVLLLLIGAAMAVLSPMGFAIGEEWAWGALLAGINVMGAAIIWMRWELRRTNQFR